MIKKIFLLVFCIIALSCSSDKDNNASTEQPVAFYSGLNVNYNSFSPGSGNQFLRTILYEGVNNGASNKRVFRLSNNPASSQVPDEELEFSIFYPASQSSIDGTYVFNNSGISSENYAQGHYTIGSSSYYLTGSIKITYFANNSYKLELITVKANDFSSALQMPVTGYCQGVFY